MRILRQRLAGRDYVETLLERELAGARLSGPDRGLCQELTYGVTRWQATLDWLIARKTTGRTQKEALQILLQLGLYQMFWLQRIPDHAAVDETVEMARELGFGPQSGFINAVLRGYAREREATEKLLAQLKTTQLALGHSHPEWLIERWRGRWGAASAAQLMDWNNTPPPTYARVNSLKTDTAPLLAKWHAEGVKFSTADSDWVEPGLVFRLEGHPSLANLPSFQAGLFYIQDPSTLLAVKELDPQPGDTVLDVCAAPGGKTTFIAQCLKNNGKVIARDNAPDRLELINENCDRLGVTCVKTELSATASSTGGNLIKAGKILLDAPCSNTGVMRRRVDLRWRVRPEEISRLQRAQLVLLRDAATQLSDGGILVYSTCSLEPEENSGVIQQFLASHPQLKLEHERELLPFRDGVDGAYVARLRKV